MNLKNLNFFIDRKRVLLFFLFLLFVYSGNSHTNYKIINFTGKEGLPRNIVSSCIHDDYGYIWVGTGNGIARFDGYNFVTYELFKGRNVTGIVSDESHRVWVGTDIGLYIYNRLNDSFLKVAEGYIDQISTYNNSIYYMLVNKLVKVDSSMVMTDFFIEGIYAYAVTENGIWYNAFNKGVNLMGTSKYILPNRYVSFIKKVETDLWIACRNGDLFRMDKNYVVHKISIQNRQNIMDVEKINGHFWVATDGNGIIVLNSEYNVVDHLRKRQGVLSQISSNSIYDVSPGLNNAVWISTYGSGLMCLVPDNNAFVNYIPVPGNINSLVDKEGISVFVDGESIYLGTNYGLSVYNNKEQKFLNFSSDKLQEEVNGTKVTAVTKVKNNLWVATYDGVIGEYSDDYKLINSIHPCSDSYNEMQRVIFLEQYDEGNLLIGTQYKGKNLLRYNILDNNFSFVEQSNKTQERTNFQVNCMKKNKFGELIALIRNAGIFIYNPETNTLDNFLPEINNRITFKLNDFYHDKYGNYWFTTQSNGLVHLSPDGRIFDKWTTEQGLPTNSLLRLESTDDRFLWISTIEGLCRFDMRSGEIQVYTYRHGLPSNEFIPRTSAVTADNRVIFGNTEGFTIINEHLILEDTSKVEVVISDINFQNKSIKKIDEKNFLSKPLEETKKITLPFKYNSFTINFFTRDNYLPKFNNFKYRLLGLEDDWIYLGENNQTTYTNLSPGKYLFEVKSTNNSNVWSEKPTLLEINIQPPWYLTWWALSSFLLLILFVIHFFMNFYRKRLRLKKEIEISDFKIQKEHELTEKKLAFFTNISHDLKTPLTLIAAPVTDLLGSDNLTSAQKHKLEIIKRNSAWLYKLISDLLDFRRISQKQLPLRVGEVDLKFTIENIYESFILECKKKDIDFSFIYQIEGTVFTDVKKIEKIIWNLLANAVRYTDEGGRIWMDVRKDIIDEKDFLKIEIGDTGKGFTKDEQGKIFDRFYQVEKSENLQFEGTGIGLSIVNDLVEIHHGAINIESEPMEGSLFTLLFPANKKDYLNEEIINDSDEVYVDKKFKYGEIVKAMIPDNENKIEKKVSYNKPKMLLVEDSEELTDYLRLHFIEKFVVFVAKNGKDGFDVVCDREPDLIITDIIMPEIDGVEFCKKVRENFNTSHIPIIMLTANSETEQKIKGLAAGADSYLIKPFDIKYLDAVVDSLLLNRKRAKEKFLGIGTADDDSGNINEQDLKFVNDLKEYIMDNLSNESLYVDDLAKKFSISRAQLNRKIKALTQLTPNNYIKNIRLKKAYELIKIKKVRVAEAAYMTGFNDPNYFTICFKKEFGENPSKI